MQNNSPSGPFWLASFTRTRPESTLAIHPRIVQSNSRTPGQRIGKGLECFALVSQVDMPFEVAAINPPALRIAKAITGMPVSNLSSRRVCGENWRI